MNYLLRSDMATKVSGFESQNLEVDYDLRQTISVVIGQT